MSFLLTCPNCGPRDVSEFRYGGQLLPHGALTQPRSSADKKDGANLPEVQRERWYHRFGCRRWLCAERDVRSNFVVRTAWLDRDEP